MRHLLLFAGFLFLISCGEKPKPEFISIDKPFFSYKNTRFVLELGEYKREDLKIECDCNYTIHDSVIYVQSRPDIPVKFKLNGSEQVFMPEPNPLFNPDWLSIEGNKSPTPLTAGQHSVVGTLFSLKHLNKPCPEFVCEDISSDDLEGKVTVINFWYNRCVPCMSEIPALNNLVENYAGNELVQFWAFSADSVLKGHDDYHFKHHLASEELRDKFSVPAFPMAFLVDQYGIVRLITMGAAEYDNMFITDNFIWRIDDLLEI